MEGRVASAGATPVVVQGRGRRSRDGTGIGASCVARRMTAPGDCLKRLVLARFERHAASSPCAAAVKSLWERLIEHAGILIRDASLPMRNSGSLVPFRRLHSVGGMIAWRRSVATPSSASAEMPIRCDKVEGLNKFWIVREAVSYSQNVRAHRPPPEPGAGSESNVRIMGAIEFGAAGGGSCAANLFALVDGDCSWCCVFCMTKLSADIKRCRHSAPYWNLLCSDIWEPYRDSPSAIHRSLWISDAEVTQVKMRRSIK